MPRYLPSWRLCRRIFAATALIALCLLGYRRGYHAEHDRFAGQTPVVVRHKVDDLMGPDYSAAGMTTTADSLIALVTTLRLDDPNRKITFATSRATASFTLLDVTTHPYLQKSVENLLNQIRKPPSS